MSEDFQVLVCSGKLLTLEDDLREFPSVTLAVETSDPLRNIAVRAQGELGFDWPWVFFHFVTEPENGRRYQAPLRAFVMPDGSLLWTAVQIEAVRVTEVIRTKEKGLFDGDPMALLIEEPLGGDSAVPGWTDLLRFLEGLGGAYGGIVALTAAAKSLHAIIDRFERTWAAKNATPMSFLMFILERDLWNYSLLARLLGISLSAAVELLTALGYEQDTTDPLIFRLSTTAPASPLRAMLEEEMLHFDPREYLRNFWRAQGLTPPPSNP